MPYQLNYDVWIQAQADRCRGVLLQNMNPTETYTLDELLALCANLGLVYTTLVYQQIGQILLQECFLVQV